MKGRAHGSQFETSPMLFALYRRILRAVITLVPKFKSITRFFEGNLFTAAFKIVFIGAAASKAPTNY